MRGSVRKRGSTWSVIYDEPSLGGPRRQKWKGGYRTKKLAERALLEVLEAQYSGTYVTPKNDSTGAFLTLWLEDYAKTNVRPRVYRRYAGIVDQHLIPEIGHVPLTQLRPRHIQNAHAKALKDGRKDGRAGGLSPTTVIQHHRVLSKALSQAVAWGALRVNPATAVSPPRKARVDISPLDEEGSRRFLEASKNSKYYPLFYTALHTGMRLSELLGLRWKMVDLDSNELYIVETLQYDDGQKIFDEPKTQAGRRRLDLSPSNATLLRNHRAQQKKDMKELDLDWSPDRFVFCNPDASPYVTNDVTSRLKMIVQRKKFEKFSFHDLRHTHASLLLKQNVHPKVVSERLGHASVSITLDIYSHVLPGIQGQAAISFDEALKSG